MYEAYSTPEFESQNTYLGHDLGAVWSAQKTVFRVWAPTATEVTVNLYRSGTPETDDLLCQMSMKPDINGTWVAERIGDLHGFYYTYLVMVDGHMQEACDPYARSTGVNGRRAMILNMSVTDPEGWDSDTDPNAGIQMTDAFLYELHIRDFSMHRSSRIRNKGKFLAMTEAGKKTKTGRPTGLAHIKGLGVTHVHLLPVYDYGFTDESRRSPQYNWGYDPVNFNVPEGSYSTNPFDGISRVTEMKQMVKAFHDNGLSVVMDVVYNHVYQGEDFCFNQIVPGYFSRISPDGVWSNGSCCGNDTASERSMVRKYIVDSVNYWADEYHIDGFRFDLVGLLDIQTINEIMRTVHRKHPNVIFYGEGWTMDTRLTKPGVDLAIQSNSYKLPGFAFFSDTIRDLLRGSVFDNATAGYVSGAYVSKDQLEACFMGVPMWAAAPCQSINYVSCHDNNTLYDRISLAAPEAPAEIKIRMNNLAAAFTILSQGVPFMQAGEELLRTKPGKKGTFDHNSYRSPDRVNAIRWEDLDKPDYQKTVDYYRGLIAFRKAHPGLRYMTREAVLANVHPIRIDNPHVAAFMVEEKTTDIFLVFNADAHDIMAHLPAGHWDMHIHEEIAGTEILNRVEGWAHVAAHSATVLTRKKPVDVVAALIWEKDKFLICQRPENKARGLLWEFVGGKVEPGETKQQALMRECMEELAINVKVGSQFMEVLHEYPDMLIRLTLFHCTIPEGFPQALEHNDLRWIHPSQTDDFDFCPADTDILKEIKRIYMKRKPL
ncbi:MAG: type I pullulanase [Oscillospiraceae bacterium]|nr:type I pullulanase [Oscillospiraceae bacterium]